MAAINVFALPDDGGNVGLDYGPDVLDPQVAYGHSDGTEWIVAIVVLTALAILAGFQLSGFRSILTVGR